MTKSGREATRWLVAIGVIAILAVALALRGGSLGVGQAPPASADAVAAATLSPTPSPRSTPEPTARPTATPVPATPTPIPATPAPTPVPVAAAPAPAATPVPVHDDDPVLLTEDRVEGTFGTNLTIGNYQVRAIRKTTPSTHECATRPGVAAFEVTIRYNGPLEAVYFDVASLANSACFHTDVVGVPWVASGVTADVFIEPSEGNSLAGKPLTVWISPDGGPHTLTFIFR